MRFQKIMIILLIIFTVRVYSVIPMFYGAKALSLACSSSAFNSDINSIFLNPALLSGFSHSISGYQLDRSYSSYKGFGENLSSIFNSDLEKFEFLEINDKEKIHDKMKEVFNSKIGIYGYKSSVIGTAFKSYGIAVSSINVAVINPESNSVLKKETGDISGEMLKSLNLNFTGLSYTKYSIAYSLDFSKELSAGVTVHYLSGKIAQFSFPLMNDTFSSDSTEKDYLEFGWKEPEKKFGKVIADFSISALVGRMFKVAVIIKNYRNPIIEFENGKIELQQRTIGAVSFNPDHRTGVYLDVDLKKNDLYLNGKEVQPISFGIERLFFDGRFSVRAGLMSDLTEKYLFGGKARFMYGMGFGVKIKRVFVDAGIGIGGDGKVNSFAVSCFFIVR